MYPRLELPQECPTRRGSCAAVRYLLYTLPRTLINKLRRLGRTGQWQEALYVLRTAEESANEFMKAAPVQWEEEGVIRVPMVGTVAYNATLAALSKGARWQEALQLLAEMEEKGIERDTISFSSAISA